MATPVSSKVGFQYLGNTNKDEVHDLYYEQTNCQIDEIITAEHAVNFSPDSLDQATTEGFDNCHYCIGNSTR